MKMLYLRKPKNPRSLTIKILKIVGIIGVVIAFNVITGGWLKSQILKFSGIIWKEQDRASNLITYVPDVLKTKKSLLIELGELRGALENERAANRLKIHYFETRHNDLKNVCQFSEENSENEQKKQIAFIIGKPPKTARDTIALDLNGKNLLETKKVYAEKFIIGTIEPGGSWPAIVSLFGKKGEKTEILLGEKRIPVIATGEGNGSFLAFVPLELEINQNEPVYLNNLTSGIFGYVSNVSRTKEGDRQMIIFRSPINLNELNAVEIR